MLNNLIGLIKYWIKDKNPFQKHLYVIGNGFDIHHDIKSRYSNYKEWLKENDKLLFDDIGEFFGRNDEKFWNEFEKNLSNVSVDSIYAEIGNNIPNTSSLSFRDSDYENAIYAIEFHLKETFNKIKESFEKWIASLNQPNELKKIVIHNKKSLYINFNYTPTLECLYGISEKNIDYIHGKCNYNQNLILGHCTNKDEIVKNVKENSPLKRKDPDDLDIPDTLFDNALDKAVNEIDFMRKNVDLIMNTHTHFFDRIKKYSYVHIYGLSFGDVDLPYLKKIVDIVGRKRITFEISDFKGYAQSRIIDFMKKCGIKECQYKIIELSSLIRKRG